MCRDLMSYSLWCADELLGDSNLTELQIGSRKVLSGPFQPTPSFAELWPLFRATQLAQTQLLAEMQDVIAACTPTDYPERVRSSPGFLAYSAAEGAVAALPLEVRRSDGSPVADVSARVSEWAIPLAGWSDVERASAEREATADGYALGGLFLTVMPSGAYHTAPGEWPPSPAL
ncbi:hypothetical protein BH11GEM2_BH11GEM2_29060 [soil metagenome]